MTWNLLPIVMIKNEEIWIERVLDPLVRVFGTAIVGDTGSTDSTIPIVRNIPGVDLTCYPNLSIQDVGVCRQWLQEKAMERGAEHVLMVDGDELYHTTSLMWILQHPMPADKTCGFTTGVEVTQVGDEIWELDNMACRTSIFPATAKWRGVYPFESPDVWQPDTPQKFHYWENAPGERYHYVHLHQLKRSTRDHDVHMRKDKQFLFALQSRPDIKPVRKWVPDE